MSKRTKWLLVIGVIATLVVGFQVVAYATVSSDEEFEAADGNLAPEGQINFDWNSFSPVTWTGTAPKRTADKSVSGWDFDGIEDAQATTSDSAFAGGTKQDDCATAGTGKAPNKDDLRRVYFSTKTVNGNVFLNLAWVRIPQNTTSPSAHIGFEFNQGSTACPAGSDGLVRQTAGDMLIVYDFEGGATDNPTITLRRWLTDPTDPAQAGYFTNANSPCDVDADSPPCWGTPRTCRPWASLRPRSTRPARSRTRSRPPRPGAPR